MRRSRSVGCRGPHRRQRQCRRIHRRDDLVEHAPRLRLAHPEVPAPRDVDAAEPRQPGESLGCLSRPQIVVVLGDERDQRRAATRSTARAPPRSCDAAAARAALHRRCRDRVRTSRRVPCRTTSRRATDSARPRSATNDIAAATSARSATPSPNEPSLVPRGELVPRVLNRSTARSASAGQPGRRLADDVRVHEAAGGRQRMQRHERRNGRPVERRGELADEREPVGRVQLDLLAARRAARCPPGSRPCSRRHLIGVADPPTVRVPMTPGGEIRRIAEHTVGTPDHEVRDAWNAPRGRNRGTGTPSRPASRRRAERSIRARRAPRCGANRR